MTDLLEISLLGGLKIKRGGLPVTEFASRKAEALLVYLVCTGRPHAREVLADLLWDDRSQTQAMANLRVLLTSLRQALGPYITITRQTMAFNQDSPYWLDVAELEQGVAAARLQQTQKGVLSHEAVAQLAQALALYQGDFLLGFYLRDSQGFEEWLVMERERLRLKAIEALHDLIAGYLNLGEYPAGIEQVGRLLQLDPLQEEAHRQLMRLLVYSGQRNAALSQYDTCRRVLADELGVEPTSETSALYERIRAGELSRGAEEQGSRGRKEIEGTQGNLNPSNALVQSSTGADQQSPVGGRRPAASEETTGASPTTLEDEMRLVTILCADMSHAVETMWPDQPEEMADLLKHLLTTLEQILGKYQARVDRFLGNRLLAVFGAPQLHEDDPERAIRAALEIQAVAQELGLGVSMGINTGVVYFGGMNAEARRDITVMGPVVNLAARLQAQAETGQILVGPATYRHTQRAFRFSPLLLDRKGSGQPVTAYQVARLRRRPEKSYGLDELRAELIGRDEELAKLKAALAETLQGHGQIVSIIGEAGVGKSRLVAELKQSPISNLQSLTWLEGRCLELGMTASYWPFIDIFRAYFAFQPEDDEPARAERLVSVLREMVGQGELSKEQFEELGPLLGQLLSLRFGNDWDQRLKHANPAQIQHQTFQAVYDFWTALARRQPVVLVFEDVHWADGLSLDLISLLMEALATASLLLLCVYRPEQQHKCWHLATIASRKCPASYTELRLRELTSQQSRRLVEALLVIDNLPASVKELILEKSQGNPFFVEEVIWSLIDGGLVYQEGESWRAQAGIEAVVVPESVQSVILSRVDRLAPALKQVLQPAAVIGRLFRRRVLAEVTLRETDLDQTLAALEDHGLIYQERAVPEVEYSFKHVLTQEAVYQTIRPRRRAELHRQVAEALEKLYQDNLEAYYEQLAYHYNRSNAVEKAIEYLLKAAEKARRAYLNDEAIGYFQRALERLDSEKSKIQNPATGTQAKSKIEWRLAALRGLGQIYVGLGKLAEAEESFRQALALGREVGLTPRESVRLSYWLGEVLFWQSRFDELIRLGEAGLALLGDDTQSVEAALMNQAIVGGYYRKGIFGRYLEFTYCIAQFIQRLPYTEELRRAYVYIIAAYKYDKNVEEAMRWLQVFEQRAEQYHDLRALGEVHIYAGELLAQIGDGSGAIWRAQQALELLTKIADPKARVWCLELMGWCFLSRGDFQNAGGYLSRALETTQAVGNKKDVAKTYELTGTLFLGQGAGAKAVNAFRAALQLCQEIDVNTEISLESLGRAYLAQGKRRVALRQFQDLIALARRDAPVWGTFWRPPFAATLSGLEEAYQNFAEFQAFCRRFRAEHPEASPSSFVQWYLEPTQADFGFTIVDFGLDKNNLQSLISNLQWTDPFGDCSFTVENGLVIHAANARDLSFINWSAPRLLRPMEGDFAVQTLCVPASDGKPAIGGVLLWKDRQNYLRLNRGVLGEHEILFSGSLANKDIVIGRGQLPETARVFLRLERLGHHVKALCSADGQAWYTVGHVEFPVQDPVEVGMHAIGNIDRTIYHGAYPDGTAIRFESFQVWQRPPSA